MQTMLLFYVKDYKWCILNIIYSCEFYHVVIGMKNTIHALTFENQLCCVMEKP